MDPHYLPSLVLMWWGTANMLANMLTAPQSVIGTRRYYWWWGVTWSAIVLTSLTSVYLYTR